MLCAMKKECIYISLVHSFSFDTLMNDLFCDVVGRKTIEYVISLQAPYNLLPGVNVMN